MGKDSPKAHQLDSKKRNYTRILITAFCCFFFYILGAWQNGPKDHANSSIALETDCNTALDFTAHHASTGKDTGSGLEVVKPCDMSFSEHTPCEDAKRSLQFDRDRLIYRERHCPPEKEKLHCLIPAPPGYKNPFSWPKSRDVAWFANVPHKELTVEKAIQNWIQYEGDKFIFPGGGTMFPRGADAYIDEIDAILPLSGGNIRTALDTGCGVASWGAYLLKRNILTMSFAPRDTHEGQVQFALERGVPAMIGIMASQRLPYPARAFDMAHCSRCLIPWNKYDGVYLIEVDRVLRPGGYWILSGPPVNWEVRWKGWERTKEDLKAEMDSIEDLARRLCWKKLVQRGNLAVWQKPWNHFECTENRNSLGKPHICKGEDPDFAWYQKMETCITPLPTVTKSSDVAGGKIANWPERSSAVPPRITAGEIPEVTPQTYNEDTKLWTTRLSYYKKHVTPLLATGRYRNIMDMNAGLGGFAAALVKEKVWVMNVVPHDAKLKTLGVIYERGFIGVYHDWCEAFSTYPRTYDFLHADGLFSMYQDRCDVTDILIEMDRILRPEGAIVIRDDVDVLNKLRKIMSGIRWESKLVDHESGPFNKEKILVAVKTYWVGGPSSSNSTTDA